MYSGIIKHYRNYLPVEESSIVTLCEGNTSLLPAYALSEKCGAGVEVYLKLEGLNPTGSFKDRGMTYAVSKAKEAGSKAVICASTGNTSAAAAAYAARANMKSIVLIPEGKIALGKLSQAMMHGAEVFQVRGNFDEALQMVKDFAALGEVTLVNSVNPFRLMGQKSAAYEIMDALQKSPTHHFIPVGNAGNITAYWRGYNDYFNESKVKTLPKMIGFQARGSAPIVAGYEIKQPETLATAIRIGKPENWHNAKEAISISKGFISAISDEDILEAYQFLALNEGYFCEPASAIGVAGILKLAQANYFKQGDVVVCTLTGHGLKDPDNAIKISKKPTLINASLAELKAALL